MKDQIFSLRYEGKSYKEIQSILGCSKSTISYYLGEDQLKKIKIRNKELNANNPLIRKLDTFKNKHNRTKGKKVKSEKFGWKEIVEKYGWETNCYLSGQKIDLRLPETYSFDHIVPKSKGGNSSLDNLGITTKKANQAKSDILLNDFFDLCKMILEKNGYRVEKNVVL
jgi:5-methylcytosine-specific restriction endonuclease McrA